MFCKNCGSTIGDQTVFCPTCGTKVQETAAQQQTQPVQNNYPTQQPAPAPAPAPDLRSALNLNTDTTALFSYIAAGCSALAAILWGFIGVSKYGISISLYEGTIEPKNLTFLTVFIIMAFAASAILMVLPQLGVLNSNILSKKTAINSATIIAVVVNIFAYLTVTGLCKGIELGDMNVVTFLFFISAWIGLAMTIVVYNKTRKSNK